jgi:hypothetical protein
MLSPLIGCLFSFGGRVPEAIMALSLLSSQGFTALNKFLNKSPFLCQLLHILQLPPHQEGRPG